MTSSLKEQIENFVRSGGFELKFPASLTTFERMLVHKVAESAGLLHESHGRGDARKITVRRKVPVGSLEKVNFNLKVSLEKEYNLSDLLPVVRESENPQFKITFVLDNVIVGVVPFEGLHHLLLPISLPEVEVSLQRPPGTALKMRAVVSLNGNPVTEGSFFLPNESGTLCTSVQLSSPLDFEEELLPGTQPPALKVCLSLQYTSSKTLEPAVCSPSPAVDSAISGHQPPEKESLERFSPAKEQQVHAIIIKIDSQYQL